MNILRSIKKRLFKKKKNYPFTSSPSEQKPVGRVLVSYLADSMRWNDNDKRFNGHTNYWESREIVRIFNKLGYIVDVINWDDKEFYPDKDYDVVFDIHYNLQRLAPFLKKEAVKILHMTGSHTEYSVKKELERVEAFEKRKNAIYSPKRIVDTVYYNKSLELANACSLIGNENTLSTFPEKYRNKITPVIASSSILNYIKTKNEFCPQEREFLWFNGFGAVHKGLDQVIEVFARNKNLTLNIIGNIEAEKDFWKIYENELTNSHNIKYYGYLTPENEKFIEISKKTFCFISASCSEGISTAATTCLQVGFYPILSRDTGISLLENSGIYLKECTIDEIEKAVLKVYEMSEADIKGQIESCQNYALKQFSRENFSKVMTEFLKKEIF